MATPYRQKCACCSCNIRGKGRSGQSLWKKIPGRMNTVGHEYQRMDWFCNTCSLQVETALEVSPTEVRLSKLHQPDVPPAEDELPIPENEKTAMDNSFGEDRNKENQGATDSKLSSPAPRRSIPLSQAKDSDSEGMRMSGESTETLYLTFLERESAGSYACGATNTEGETRSSGLTLKVQYAPRCKPGTEQTSVGAVDSSTISVRCEVDADPPDSVRFSWTYNNTRNVSPVLNSRVQSEGLVSTMTYLPPTDSEFITLACWASNSVGRQITPCLVHVLPAKIPEAPKSCELHNDTILEVICIPGNDGGLAQHFLLEAIGTAVTDSTESMRNRLQELDSENELSTMNDQATSAPLHRMQEPQPQFRLSNLEPGREYQLYVYAINAKGRSNPPVVLEKVRVSPHLGPYDETILSEDPTPAETTHQSNEKQSTMVILAAVIAGAAVIVTSIIVAGVVVVCKQRPKPPEPQEVRKRMRPARKDVPSMYIEEDGFNDEDLGRPAEIRHHSRASTGPRTTRYVSEGFVQYSQPSLSVYVTDPDLILPRGDEFTNPTVTNGGA